MKSKPAVQPGPRMASWVRESGALKDVLSGLDLELKQRKRKRRRRARAGVAALAAIIGLAWLIPYATQRENLATVAATRQTFALADGSQAELNARTSLATDFRYGRRITKLAKGEAYFSVRSDPAHPFIVETPAGEIRVTGTEFNVRVLPTGQGEVTLFKGVVTVEPASGSSVVLSPGQQSAIETPHAWNLSEHQLAETIAWRKGRAVFSETALKDAAARFADYHGVTINVAPDVSHLRLGGSYAIDDLAQFLEALPDALPVRVIRQAENTYVITAG